MPVGKWVRLWLVGLVALAAAGAAGGEASLKLGVLRADAQGAALDVLLRIEVLSGLAEELAPADFAVYIAPADLSATDAAAERYRLRRIFLKRSGNSYYLDLRQLPPDAGSAACQLIVRITRGGQVLAAHHVARFIEPGGEDLDVALLIDESLSMRRTDRERLRIAAAKTFVDLAARSPRIGRIGIVAFCHEARTLAPLTSPAETDALYKAIDEVATEGQTDMDGALKEAEALLAKSPNPAKALILLTDGKDEPGRYEDAHRAFAERRWRIYTVGLSERADADVLQRIARDTGGEYHEAPTNAELQDIFGRICLTLQKKVPIRARGLLLQTNVPAEDALAVDDTMSSLTVSLNAHDPDLGFVLRGPGGRLLTPELPKGERSAAFGRKANYQHYDLWTPPPGQWTARVTSPRPAHVTLASTAVTPLVLRAFPLKPSYYRGEPIELAVSLANGDIILADAKVEARVARPSGAEAASRVGDAGHSIVPLHDDGRHGDTAANDGVFAALLPGCEQAGECAIQVVASGTTPAGHRFERELNLTATISTEGCSKLWVSPGRLDFGTLYSGEAAEKTFDLKLISPLPAREDVTFSIADFRLPIEIENRKSKIENLDTGRLAPVTIAVRVPPGQKPGSYSGTIELASKYDRLSLPVSAEVRQPKLVFDRATLDLGSIESGGNAEGAFTLKLEPRGAVPAKLAAPASGFSITPNSLSLSEAPATVRVAVGGASLPREAAGEVKAKVVVETPVGTAELPVVVRVVRPGFAVAPAALDFGEVSPGQVVERQLTLSVVGLTPREAALSATPLAGPQGVAALALDPLEAVNVKPEEPAAVPVRLRVPPAQPPGVYRGELVAKTPLGERKVACTATVGAANTFEVAAALDFDKVAIGTSKELRVEVASLVDAEQRVELGLPPKAADWGLAAEPTWLTLPPRGKAAVTFRLTAAEAAKPGPRNATVAFRGPSRGASLEARALLFRPPHQSIAFEPAEIDLGRLQAGIAERLSVQLKSLVDEPQAVAIEGVDAPAEVVAVGIEPREFTVPASGSQALALTLSPAAGPDEEPFEAVVTARGRSLPASLRIRGVVFSPPRKTFEVPAPVLDFGVMSPGQRAELALAIESVYRREQRVSLANAPTAPGLTLVAERQGAVLLPGVTHPIGIELAVAPDAAPGERRLAWEVRGPGDPASFEVRVEVVQPQAPAFGHSIATTKPGGIGWLEGALLFLLLLVLLAILVGTYLLARRLLRSPRVPRMARFFAFSALLHVAALFITLDIFLAEKVRKRELGQLFRVGVKAVAAGGFTSQQASAADEVRAQAERERRLDAERRQQEAARLAREMLESERRKLDPTLARLDKPKAEEKVALAPREPEAKKVTVEDIAEVVEELREASRAKEARKPDARDAAPVSPERIAALRELNREQLESIVREAMKPKAAVAERAPSAPEAPALAEARPSDKVTLAVEEVLPAMDALKGELSRSEGAARPSAAPAAGDVEAQRATQGPVAERGSRSGERAARGETPRAIPDSRFQIPDRGDPGVGLPGIGSRQSAISNPRSAPVSLDTPVEVVAPAEGVGQRVPEAAGIAPRQVTASRPGSEASIERGTMGGERVARGETPRAIPDSRFQIPDRGEPAGGLPQISRPQSAVSGPRHAPIAVGTPDEQPAVDPLVELPGTPQDGRGRPEPVAVSVARAQASGGGAVRRATAPAAAGLRGDEPKAAPAERPTLTGSGLPMRGPAAGRPGTKVAPKLDDLELAEGPLVAARQSAPRGASEVSPQPVVALWRPQSRGDEGGHVATAAAGGVQLAPRGGAVERPAADQSIGHAPAVAPQRAPRATAPVGDVRIEEQIETAPRASAGGERAGAPVGPGSVAPRREVSVVSAERGELAAARVALDAPRAGEGGQRPVDIGQRAEEGTRTLPASSPRPGGPQALPTTEARPQESVEIGERVAAAEAGPKPLGPSDTGLERPAPAPVTRHASRVTPPASPSRLSPRSADLALARSSAPSRLLLPALAARGGDAGALVGDAAGTARNIVLTTIKYGGGEADWDAHRTAMPFLAWQLRERVGFNLETDVQDVPLASDKVMNSPWVFMTGHKDFRLSDAEVASLRRYLLGGGTLWAEDCTHEDDPTWDRAFRREIARVLAPADGHRLRKVTKDDDHPLFRSCFDLSQGYKGYFPPPGDKFRQSYLEGIELDGRLAVIYSRNDYGCGLEIKPDTHPGKVSLSSLSPAEMQESSFLMASNIIVYVLTGGRGVADQGLAGRAAASLRKHLEAKAAERDPYEKAPATVFESFADDRWLVETEWQGAAPANLRFLRRADPDAEGKRLAVSFQLRKGDAKAVLVRDLPQETDLSAQGRCYLDIESRLEGGARLAVALITMPDWKYFESRPAFIKPGRQRVHFDLDAPTWKTGEPVPEGESEYLRKPANLQAVRRFVVLLYPVQTSGTIILDQIEFRAKP